jgi:hypothetical protein
MGKALPSSSMQYAPRPVAAHPPACGQVCCFCGQKFCLPHCMPEMHGCGDAAKKSARGNFKVPNPPDKPPTRSVDPTDCCKVEARKAQASGGLTTDERKRALLQNKLGKSLTEKAGARGAQGGGEGAGGGKKTKKKKK